MSVRRRHHRSFPLTPTHTHHTVQRPFQRHDQRRFLVGTKFLGSDTNIRVDSTQQDHCSKSIGLMALSGDADRWLLSLFLLAVAALRRRCALLCPSLRPFPWPQPSALCTAHPNKMSSPAPKKTAASQKHIWTDRWKKERDGDDATRHRADSAAPPCSRHEFKFGAQRSFLRQQRSLGDRRDATAAVARLARAATRRHHALMHASHVCASGGVVGRRRAHSLPLPPPPARPPPPSASAAAHCRRRWPCVLVHADSTEKAAPKKAAVEKKRKDPNAPKGALTAYIIFRYESTTCRPCARPISARPPQRRPLCAMGTPLTARLIALTQAEHTNMHHATERDGRCRSSAADCVCASVVCSTFRPLLVVQQCQARAGEEGEP